ncbi:pentapeptide repeat-containing protein [Campylobacter jejuni]|uniref:Pentapeptide repeat-containing protein n=1 Tax=Campylobacter jejuni TaxID=197 RepID=A0A693B158_CAMJU|nr:pentapeptide repeat-containing protein [Campylobacter jejuni]EAJ1872772.1 pentapeptide repeat-containing protein [Campylobacter coli]EAB5288016.1 pentapeptide repeat-containing protein [Campylobacter jejuni]EAH9772460.1 pentapeptide repeat-containing protein [Campylobacter jejuni]EAI2665575.1 pentapeptide repeat-containing protein [Campylobacter jejuni]EAI4625173.1 pentapeptide repeat-containing protein [Campylobacter jejuni]
MDLVSSFLSKKNINNEEDIKFENYIKGEAKLNSEKQYIIESSCCFDGNKDNFKRHYDENKILEIHLNNMLFEQDLVFDNVKKLSLIINDNVKFNKLFINNCNELYLQFNGRVEVIDKISINDCKFKQISINNHIDGNIEFQKCEFNDFNLYGFSNATIKGTFTFDFCEIKEKVNFMNFEFENKVSFKMSKFKDNVYFNNSHFKDYVDFHECEFEKIACFYGVKFYKTPNFSACYFKEPKAVNLINVDIDKLDFKSVEKYIEDNYQDESYKNAIKNNEKIQKDEKELYRIENEHKLRYAKNLKDSFRVIKDVLINQNNTLEAQEWHKLELYAKEKELEIQLSKNKNDNLKKESKNQVYNPKDYEKFNYSKIIPLIIFLLKIIGHLSVNILIFVELVLVAPFFTIMFYCVYVVFFIYKILTFILKSFYPLDINKFIIFWRIKFNKIKRKLIVSGRKMLDFTLWSDCVLLQVYRNTSNHHTNFLKILNFTILMISLYAFMGFVFSKTINFILSFNSVSIIIASYIILLVFALMLVNVKKQLYQYGVILIFMLCGAFTISMILFLSSEYISIFCFLIYFLGVLIFYLFFICKIKLFIFLVRFFAYMIFIATIITKPQFINPFTGVFSSDKLYESQFEKSLNDLNASAIVNLASILQNDFNLHLKDQNISFTELNSAKALIIANKENLLKLNDANLNITKEVLGEKYTELLKIINQDKITENTIKSTSVLYSIILLLCIFSLQKTARKNSIVPS